MFLRTSGLSLATRSELALRCLTLDGGEVLCGESQEVGAALKELFPCATVDTQSVFDVAAI